MSAAGLYVALLVLGVRSEASAVAPGSPSSPAPGDVVFVDGRFEHSAAGEGIGLGAAWLHPMGERAQAVAALSVRSFGGTRWRFGTVSANARLSSTWLASAELSFGGGRARGGAGSERTFGYHTQKILVGWLHPGGRFGATGSLQRIDVDESRGFLTEARVQLAPRPDLALTFGYGATSGERLSGRFVLAQFRHGTRRSVSGGIALGANDERAANVVLADRLPTLHVYGGMSFPCRATELALFVELQRVNPNGTYRQAVLLVWKVPL